MILMSLPYIEAQGSRRIAKTVIKNVRRSRPRLLREAKARLGGKRKARRLLVQRVAIEITLAPGHEADYCISQVIIRTLSEKAQKLIVRLGGGRVGLARLYRLLENEKAQAPGLEEAAYLDRISRRLSRDGHNP